VINRVTNRRDFFAKTFALGAAGALAMPTRALSQQKVVSGIHSSGLYADSMIFERKPFKWPGGKTIAVWIIPNVEIWAFDSAADAALAPNGAAGPDVINYATREYGMRVGLWRIADVLDAAGIKATVALNSGVCEVYPKAIDEMKKRQWEFIGHGVTNSMALSKLPAEQEKQAIQGSLETIQKATGKKVNGWVSPGQIPTANTLDYLAEFGVTYTGDWNNDDQPYKMRVKSGEMYSLPYCLIVNDTNIYSNWGFTGEQYYQSVVDQFDVLAADSLKQPRVMGLPIHPFLVGQPEHIRFFKRAIEHIKQSEHVWLASGSEIMDAYRKVEA
jgi:peptidoglycan/xylan/chitin deacetylase (PgdA/CDA1 family)